MQLCQMQNKLISTFTLLHSAQNYISEFISEEIYEEEEEVYLTG